MKKPLRHGGTEFSWMEILDCCRPVRFANIILKKIQKTKLNTLESTAFCFWDFFQNDLNGRQHGYFCELFLAERSPVYSLRSLR